MRRGLTLEELALLAALAEYEGPIGARTAVGGMRERGFNVSESTVSRLLTGLDSKRLTRSLGVKGRELTVDGRRLAETFEADERRNRAVAAALDVRGVEQLLDLLVARRGVETEAAGSAAVRGTSEEFAEIELLLDSQWLNLQAGLGQRRAGLEFHRRIGYAARNRMIEAMIDALFDPKLEALEEILDVVAANRKNAGQSALEHKEILDALKSRDAGAARLAMAGHLNRLIVDTEAYARSGNGSVIEGLLALVGGRTGVE
jgi:DNA-binding FadR family transcriptional regulator